MSIVVGIIGLLLIGAWIDQLWTQRARKRHKRTEQWWTDPDDEGDY